MVTLNRLLPTDSPKRVGKMEPKFITIHEVSLGTDVQPAEKNYQRYYNLLFETPTSVGYHFLVEANHGEDTRIYQFLETDVVTHHTGSKAGNFQSIGIERMVNVVTDMERAINAQAQLVATLMKVYNIPLHHVVPHKFWSGKQCPARLLAGMYGGWNGFIERVKYYFEKHEFIERVL